MKYTIIIGTNRPNSNSEKVGLNYLKKFKDEGLDVSLINLIDLPEDFIFSNAYGNRTEDFTKIQALISETGKFIFVIPEYNGSFPGVLKAFIDVCKFPESFKDKKCCLVGLSAGKFGNIRGLEHFAGVAHYINMNVFQNMMYLPEISDDISVNEKMESPFYKKLINEQIQNYITF